MMIIRIIDWTSQKKKRLAYTQRERDGMFDERTNLNDSQAIDGASRELEAAKSLIAELPEVDRRQRRVEEGSRYVLMGGTGEAALAAPPGH